MAVWNECASRYTDRIEAKIAACTSKYGDNVRCLRGDIDKNQHAGETGQIDGFARFTSHHPKEAHVQFENGDSAWFWVSDLEPAA